MKPSLTPILTYLIITLIPLTINAQIQSQDLPPLTIKRPTEEPKTSLPAKKDNPKMTQHGLLQGLNKITARTSELPLSVNKKAPFGTLTITLHKCWKSAPDELPENKALLEITEHIPGESKKLLFYGWMFSSSPSLSALEHPVYDVTVLECHNN